MTLSTNNQLGKQICRQRQSLLLSQEKLSELAGLTQSVISRIERGGGCNLRTLEAIAKALGCKLLIQFKPAMANFRIRVAATVDCPFTEIERNGRIVRQVPNNRYVRDLKEESLRLLRNNGESE